MGWPFSKRSTPNLTPEVEAVFERLRKFLSDEIAQVAQYPDSLKALIAAGADADQTPDGYGYFGTSPTNPIPVNGPIGEVLYTDEKRKALQRWAQRIQGLVGGKPRNVVSMPGRRR